MSSKRKVNKAEAAARGTRADSHAAEHAAARQAELGKRKGKAADAALPSAVGASRVGRNAGMFALVCVAWLAFDRITKVFVDSSYSVGQVIVPDTLAILKFNLVHNTGAAWGVFSGSTITLGVVSALLCALIAAFTVYELKRGSLLEMAALGLVFAGGVGNMVDRFMYGYVVDFITPTFIDFPTFNVADIGVTCGIGLLVVILVTQIFQEGRKSKEE